MCLVCLVVCKDVCINGFCLVLMIIRIMVVWLFGIWFIRVVKIVFWYWLYFVEFFLNVLYVWVFRLFIRGCRGVCKKFLYFILNCFCLVGGVMWWYKYLIYFRYGCKGCLGKILFLELFVLFLLLVVVFFDLFMRCIGFFEIIICILWLKRLVIKFWCFLGR